MLKEFRAALTMMIVMTAITGIFYPLAVTGLARWVFPWQAGGSLIERDGKAVGSVLIGQSFAGPGYFWGRPSATGAADPDDPAKTVDSPYNAANSSGSNLGPTSKPLAESVGARIEALKSAHPGQAGAVPADLVTTSGSGLDPHVTPLAAAWQARRVAENRRIPLDELQKLLARHTEGRDLGIFGEPRINLLTLNMSLDDAWPMR